MNPTQKQPTTSGALADLTPADILRCAARYLEIRGWTQGTYFDRTDELWFPPACVSSAIAMAVFGDCTPVLLNAQQTPDVVAYRNAVTVLVDFLDLRETPASDTDADHILPFTWNDHPARTAEQVITTLRDAADDYDWTHATEDDLETYAEHEYSQERLPTRIGYLVWRATR
ncbi:hypothetical protein AB0B39_03335 [Micromonospora sp. NPDC049114]|uniref:DUF6197 family protein n=1 Tax=Micromonospora sp. NPDC049114 TaxID=3155498 RepID=UPI0033D79F87